MSMAHPCELYRSPHYYMLRLMALWRCQNTPQSYLAKHNVCYRTLGKLHMHGGIAPWSLPSVGFQRDDSGAGAPGGAGIGMAATLRTILSRESASIGIRLV